MKATAAETMQPLDDTNVFVKYLPSSIDDLGLSELFQGCGAIKSAKVMVDHQTGLSLGFGYVVVAHTLFVIFPII